MASLSPELSKAHSVHQSFIPAVHQRSQQQEGFEILDLISTKGEDKFTHGQRHSETRNRKSSQPLLGIGPISPVNRLPTLQGNQQQMFIYSGVNQPSVMSLINHK